MAKAAKAPGKQRSARASSSAGSGIPGWLLGLVGGIVATLAPAMALLATALMAPGILVAIIDRSERRATTRAVAMFGAGAAAAPMLALWRDGASLDGALNLAAAAAPFAWVVQAGGWLLAELGPVLIGLALEATAQAETARLEQAHRDCLSEWDLES